MNIFLYYNLSGCSVKGQPDDLQYDGVVETNISECPVHYHHVRVKDLSSQLQQAEHCTPVQLCKGKGGKKRKKVCESPHLRDVETAFI